MGDFEVLPRASNKMLSLVIHPAELVQDGTSDSRNSKQVARFLTAWIVLLEDSPLLRTIGPKPRSLVKSFYYDLRGKPIIDSIIRFSELGDALASQPSVSLHGSEKGFVDLMRSTPIFMEYMHWIKFGDIQCFRFCLSFLWFGKKMDYENEAFYSTALRKWKDVEVKLATLELPDNVNHLRDICRHVLGPLKKLPLSPKFGPGYVSERGIRGVDRKSTINYDKKLDRVFFTNSTFTTEFDKEELGYRPSVVIPSFATWSPEDEQSKVHSRLKFVRKNVRTARSICMEPNAYMYMQQAVLQRVLVSIEESRISRFIDISDQTRNQYLAEWGSLMNSIDTIDLSSASDSVALNLVRRIFPRDWLYFLLGTRTSTVELPDDTVVRVNKFAPMGSALCFPVQCIIFTCIVIQAAVYYLHGQEEFAGCELPASAIDNILSLFSRKPGAVHGLEPLAVYGDDIALDTRLTSNVTELLSMFGFSVNLDKSFTGDQSFRESCGKFYIEGNDVTPLFYKLPSFKNTLSAHHIFGIIGQCNYALDSFKAYRRYLLTVLRSRVYHVLFTHDRHDTSAIMTNRHHINFHLKKRWNRHLQRDELRCVRIRVEFDQSVVSERRVKSEGRLKTIYSDASTVGELEKVEHYLYIQWHRAAFRFADGGTDESHAPRRNSAADYRVVWGWTPDYNM